MKSSVLTIFLSLLAAFVVSAGAAFAADPAKDLFTSDLSNAVSPHKWAWKNGELVAGDRETLWTKESYGDFILDLDFKVTRDSNSGVFLHSWDMRNVLASLEIQIYETVDSGKIGMGAIYDAMPPSKPGLEKPVGQWNHFTIACKGSLVKVLLNGTEIINADLDNWSKKGRNPDGTANKFPKPLQSYASPGPIGLQGLQGKSQAPVWYKNLKIQNLGYSYVPPVAATPPKPGAPVSMAGTPEVPLKSVQSSINGLLVVPLGGSRYAGTASKLSISALKMEAHEAATLAFNQQVGGSMDAALREVARFMALRHSGWPRGYRMELAFDEKYSTKDGPSAATACALVLDSLFTGVALDPEVAVTGDLNADGTVQPIGGVIAKLRGATKSGVKFFVIPQKNRQRMTDWVLNEGTAPLLGAQIFSASTYDEALELARKDRKADLQKAIDQFAVLSEYLVENPNALKEGTTHKTLAEICALAPNHVSAKLLLTAAQDALPAHLSAAGSLESVDQSVAEIVEATGSDFNASSRLDGGQVGAAKSRLTRLRNLIDPRVEPYVDAWIHWAQLADQIITLRSAPPQVRADFKRAGEMIKAEEKKLRGNAEFNEELMR